MRRTVVMLGIPFRPLQRLHFLGLKISARQKDRKMMTKHLQLAAAVLLHISIHPILIHLHGEMSFGIMLQLPLLVL